MTDLNTVRDPILPAVPTEKEQGDVIKIELWRSGHLQVLKELHANTYDDLVNIQTDLSANTANVASDLANHANLATGVHGVGAATIESNTGSQAKVDTHSALTTGVHGVGAGTVAKVADIVATKLDDFTAPDDNTDLNANTTKHGLCPKGSGNANEYLNGNIAFTIPPTGEGHITILPWNYSANTGAWGYQIDSGQYNCGTVYCANQNDELDFKAYLDVGTYTFSVMGIMTANSGIITVLIDTANQGTINQYNITTAKNQLLSLANVAVTTAGLKTIGFKIATKDGRSGGYFCYMSSIGIYRTA